MGKLATIPGADLAIKINAAHRTACVNARKSMEYAAECGRLLIEAKELVEHGEWLPWLEAHTEVSPRQSQRYMRLAENWAEIEPKATAESYLGIDGALRLLAKPKATPKPVTTVEYIVNGDEADEEETPGHHLPTRSPRLPTSRHGVGGDGAGR